MALLSAKEIKNAIKIMVEILEKLDMIYHALHDKEADDGKESEDVNQ